MLLLLQGYCSFESFRLLSSECPCAPLMGLIWYSALMPSLIFVCETKCFDGGWLLQRLCVYQRLFFSFFVGVRVLWPLTVQYTLCLLLKTRTQSIEFWIRFNIPPSSLQLCCQRAACVCMWQRARRCECSLCVLDACDWVGVCVCVFVGKVNYCKRLPINLLYWKLEWYWTNVYTWIKHTRTLSINLKGREKMLFAADICL